VVVRTLDDTDIDRLKAAARPNGGRSDGRQLMLASSALVLLAFRSRVSCAAFARRASAVICCFAASIAVSRTKPQPR